MKIAALVLLLASETLTLSAAPPPANAIAITALSAHADRISGGDVLVRVVVPSRGARLRAALNGRDVTTAFKVENDAGGRAAIAGSGSYLALLTGLVEGPNMLRVSGGIA